MPPRHLDRLTTLEASFLAQEGPAAHMQLGAVIVFAGPAPPRDAFLAHIRSRLHLVPRYRHKLAVSQPELGRPFWIDDPKFNLEYHVRDTALPAPGSMAQLRQLVGRTFSQPLDRAKPLWELLLVEGLEDDRFALVSKNHHALVDGIAGLDIAAVLLDAAPEPLEAEPAGEPWTPHPEPSRAELLTHAVVGSLKMPIEMASELIEAVAEPVPALEEIREKVEGLGEVAWGLLNPAPETPLNQPIGPHRRVAWVCRPLEDVRRIREALGGTVNDVFLTLVTRALRRWLPTRGMHPEGLKLQALVPVSVRGVHERGAGGVRLAAMRGALPVYVTDPVECLRVVREEMREVKASKQALGSEVLFGLQDLAPPTLLAQASRINFSTRLFNVLVTNIPGPQVPLYLLGRELVELVPVAFLAEDHALALAVASYNGQVEFGLIADHDAVPDLDALAGYLEDAVGELLAAASAVGGGDRALRPG